MMFLISKLILQEVVKVYDLNFLISLIMCLKGRMILCKI